MNRILIILMVIIEYKKYFFDNDLNLNNGVKSNEVKEDIKNSEKSESRKEIIKSNIIFINLWIKKKYKWWYKW